MTSDKDNIYWTDGDAALVCKMKKIDARVSVLAEKVPTPEAIAKIPK